LITVSLAWQLPGRCPCVSYKVLSYKARNRKRSALITNSNAKNLPIPVRHSNEYECFAKIYKVSFDLTE